MKVKHILTLATLTALPFATATAQAAAYTWTAGPGTGLNWSTGFGGLYPTLAADTATIPPLAGPLTVNIDVANSILGNLTFGSTGFTTDIGNANSNPANRLTFDNTGNTVNNSDGNTNGAITSLGGGTATNTISNLVALGGSAASSTLNVVAASNNSLTFNGGLIGTTGSATAATRTIVNNLAADKSLTINGPITTEITGVATAAATNILQFGVGSFASSPTTAAAGTLGTTVINGVVTNGAVNNTFTVGTQLIFGSSGANNSNAIGTVVVNGANTFGSGARLFRVNLVLGSNTALGSGGFQHGSGAASGAMGFNIASNDDARTIANTFNVQRNVTFNGSNSLTWTGNLTQSNASLLINLLPAGKSLNLNGTVFTDNAAGGGKAFSFDGSGNTVVGGDVQNTSNATAGTLGAVYKNGTGKVTLNGTAGVTSYQANTAINGGILEFANLATGTGSLSSSIVVNAGGGVAVTGSTLGSTQLLTKLGASPVVGSGAILIQPADAGTAINFGTLGAGAAQLSLGSASAVTYTGAITPAAATYRLGGPSSALTLSSANALTGANALRVVNGGTTALTATNNYTGGTTVQGNYIVQNQQAAAANNGLFIQSGIYVSPTLSVTNLDDAASSVGSGAIAVNGGTLSYVGSTNDVSTKALSIGSTGATFDSSGTGTVNFSNTAAATVTDVAATTGTVGAASNTITAIPGTADINNLAVGTTITGTGIPAGVTVIGINPVASTTNGAITYNVRLSANASTAGTAVPITFGAQNRTVTLTGSNAGNNTIAAALGNSATGTLGINKTGAGTWVLSGNNTFTGATTVSAGTLVAGSATGLSSASAVTVGGGAGVATLKVGTIATSTIPSLTIASNGRVDVGVGTLVINNGGGVPALTAFAAQVATGRAGGSGVFTSSADASHDVGYLDTGTGIKARYVILGDANLDGAVNFNDFLVLQTNFGATGQFYGAGDFNYDGAVNFNDFLVLQTNFGSSLGYDSASAAVTLEQVAAMTAFASTVPEPASLALIGLGAAGLVSRRRRAR